MKSVRSCETSVNFYHATWYNIPEDNTILGLRPSSGILKRVEYTAFPKLDSFRPQVKGGEAPTVLGTLDRVNLSHWT
jgi:hypothetical protein